MGDIPCPDPLDFVIPGEGWTPPYAYGDTEPWTVVSREFECDHHRQRLTYLIYRNGSRHFKYQCTRCGRASESVGRKNLSQAERDSAAPFDDDLRDSWRDVVSDRLAELRAGYQELRQIMWWSDYHFHLMSPEWRARREAVLDRAGGNCEECGVRKAEHVHHKTYDRLGKEELDDLQALCLDCHTNKHEHMRDDQEDADDL